MGETMARTLSHHTQHEDDRFGMSHKSSMFWAVMTVLAFPLGLLAATRVTASDAKAFIAGVLACIAVLFANAAADKRLWMFHPRWRTLFDHPEFSYRLAVLCGALLLIVQTLFLVFVLFGATSTPSLLHIVQKRECRTVEAQATDFCYNLMQATDQLKP